MADFSLAQLGTFRHAASCPMKWNDLEGDGNVRFCRECSLNVYNFSDMTPAEVAAVVDKHGDGTRLCAGWYRRTDGTAIRENCPVGLRLVRQNVRRTLSRITAAAGLLITSSIALALPGRDAGKMRTYQPFAALCEWLAPTAPPPRQIFALGAVVRIPNPTPNTVSTLGNVNDVECVNDTSGDIQPSGQ